MPKNFCENESKLKILRNKSKLLKNFRIKKNFFLNFRRIFEAKTALSLLEYKFKNTSFYLS